MVSLKITHDENNEPLPPKYPYWEESKDETCPYPDCDGKLWMKVELQAGTGSDPNEIVEVVTAETCRACKRWHKEF